jgi:hypothetical protein
MDSVLKKEKSDRINRIDRIFFQAFQMKAWKLNHYGYLDNAWDLY